MNSELEKKVLELINDEAKLAGMRNNIKQFSATGAAKKIAEMLNEMVSKN
jgi:UDP-N-acetylglucosamine:LPS N-acetylglucosamine transferase